MTVLAIDTATEVLSVALRVEPTRVPTNKPGHRTLYLTASRDVGLRHSEVLMPIIDRLMEEAGCTSTDLDLVAAMRGPGSFTGLRIGMSTAKGIGAALAMQIGVDQPPVVSIPTLEVMACGVARIPGTLVVPVLDARKKRFYGGVFRDGQRLTEDLDVTPEDLRKAISTFASGPVILTGTHAGLFAAAAGGSDDWIVDPGHRRGYASQLLDIAASEFQRRGADSPDTGPDYRRETDAELARVPPPR